VTVLPSFPAKTVIDFIAYAKANPGKVNMASAGNGSSGHVSGELFKMMAGVNLVHVPHRGTPQALTDLMAGQVQVMFQAIPTTIQFVKAGKLRALAVTTAMRLDALPDVPAVAEFVPGYEASTWYGLCAPKGTPAEIVEKLNKEVNLVLPTPNLKARLAALGAEPLSMTPAEFKQLVIDETKKWGKVVKAAGIKAD
jgi:tripartite-type tricarboxylate transporter receptor subunit TctC